MEIYRISREDMLRWCSIPREQLLNNPDSKVDLRMFDTRRDTMEMAGNMMADEVKKNNAEGKITKWILGSGPEDQFQTFIDRVNNERISLKNLYIFHIIHMLKVIRLIYGTIKHLFCEEKTIPCVNTIM